MNVLNLKKEDLLFFSDMLECLKSENLSFVYEIKNRNIILKTKLIDNANDFSDFSTCFYPIRSSINLEKINYSLIENGLTLNKIRKELNDENVSDATKIVLLETFYNQISDENLSCFDSIMFLLRFVFKYKHIDLNNVNFFALIKGSSYENATLTTKEEYFLIVKMFMHYLSVDSLNNLKKENLKNISTTLLLVSFCNSLVSGMSKTKETIHMFKNVIYMTLIHYSFLYTVIPNIFRKYKAFKSNYSVHSLYAMSSKDIKDFLSSLKEEEEKSNQQLNNNDVRQQSVSETEEGPY